MIIVFYVIENIIFWLTIIIAFLTKRAKRDHGGILHEFIDCLLHMPQSFSGKLDFLSVSRRDFCKSFCYTVCYSACVSWKHARVSNFLISKPTSSTAFCRTAFKYTPEVHLGFFGRFFVWLVFKDERKTQHFYLMISPRLLSMTVKDLLFSLFSYTLPIPSIFRYISAVLEITWKLLLIIPPQVKHAWEKDHLKSHVQNCLHFYKFLG